MNNLTPLEVVVLTVFPSLAVVGVVGFMAWYWLRRRQIELAALDTDEQAARLLGECLARALVSAEVIEEVMSAFARMDSAAKRTLALSIAGLVAEHNADVWEQLGPKIAGMVRGLSSGKEMDPGADPGSTRFFDPARSKEM